MTKTGVIKQHGSLLFNKAFRGTLHAGQIGPVQVTGRRDHQRLRGKAWWPKQSLTVFQPLIPPAWKMMLRSGMLHAQVAFSATTHEFTAGGHAVLAGGRAWMPDNQINGVNFVLPFRVSQGVWHLGTRRPVSLRIDEVINQITARYLSADLQGAWPWSEQSPLQLSNVSVDVLGGKVMIQQLRMPQHTPALLRLQQLSSSELISAINVKQFALSGAFNGALPLWLNNNQWIIQDGWLNNPGPMTLRLDKDMADALVNDNIAAGAAINWLRYMEINRSWAHINMDNRGGLTLNANVSGVSRFGDKRNTVHLNYAHQENMFDLWRNLRFGDNVQTWFEQHVRLPAGHAEKQQVRNKNEKRANGHTGRDHTDRLPPRLEITASKEPITINMNVKIEHEIHISVDKDVEALLKSRSDLF